MNLTLTSKQPLFQKIRYTNKVHFHSGEHDVHLQSIRLLLMPYSVVEKQQVSSQVSLQKLRCWALGCLVVGRVKCQRCSGVLCQCPGKKRKGGMSWSTYMTNIAPYRALQDRLKSKDQLHLHVLIIKQPNRQNNTQHTPHRGFLL